MCVHTQIIYMRARAHTHTQYVKCSIFIVLCFSLKSKVIKEFFVQSTWFLKCPFSCDRNICVYSVRIPLLEPTVFLNCLLLCNPVVRTRNPVAPLSPPLHQQPHHIHSQLRENHPSCSFYLQSLSKIHHLLLSVFTA